MDWNIWMLFVCTEGALTLCPGPAVLLVVSQGLRGGPPEALRSAAGVLTVNAHYFALSATGVGALLIASERFFTALKWAGAAYLLFLGLKALLWPEPVARREESAERPRGRRAAFLRGVVTQLSNPKALLFFVAILPQFIDRGSPIVVQILILGVTSILLEFTILTAYGRLAAGIAQSLARPGLATVTRRLSGALLVGVALGLVSQEH